MRFRLLLSLLSLSRSRTCARTCTCNQTPAPVPVTSETTHKSTALGTSPLPSVSVVMVMEEPHHPEAGEGERALPSNTNGQCRGRDRAVVCGHCVLSARTLSLLATCTAPVAPSPMSFRCTPGSLALLSTMPTLPLSAVLAQDCPVHRGIGVLDFRSTAIFAAVLFC